MRQESAGHRAREVVGLYGDPDTTWGIGLELGFDDPVDVVALDERGAALAAGHPHLGPAPQVLLAEQWDVAREQAAAAPYDPEGPLVRLVLDAERRRLFVAAHHGVCDGLGLVAIADAVSGHGLTSLARGIGDRPAPRSFLVSSLGRVGEALLRPPPRFDGTGSAGAGEHLRVRSLPRASAGTVDLCLALAGVFRDRHPRGRPLFVSGASRREPGVLAPDRQTAYVRFRFDPRWSREEARTEFGRLAPEPEFPETSVGGIGPRITRLLRNRLGGTAQLSNLGVVEGDGLAYAAMFPALSGPRGVGVGLVSTAHASTLSLRTRGTEFSAADTDALLDLIAVRLAPQ